MSNRLFYYDLENEKTDVGDRNVKRLEYVLHRDSIATGILIYLFYFESVEDSCTSIRLIFYDEKKFKNNFLNFSDKMIKLTRNKWLDPVNKLQLSTYVYVSNNLTFYFMDIEPVKQ